jgi:hypothetical protein
MLQIALGGLLFGFCLMMLVRWVTRKRWILNRQRAIMATFALYQDQGVPVAVMSECLDIILSHGADSHKMRYLLLQHEGTLSGNFISDVTALARELEDKFDGRQRT